MLESGCVAAPGSVPCIKWPMVLCLIEHMRMQAGEGLALAFQVKSKMPSLAAQIFQRLEESFCILQKQQPLLCIGSNLNARLAPSWGPFPPISSGK